jgi:hypothetical protein
VTVADAFRELGHQIDAHGTEIQVGLERGAVGRG